MTKNVSAIKCNMNFEHMIKVSNFNEINYFYKILKNLLIWVFGK